MNWRIDWDIVTLARILGVVIIVAGIVLSALDASALNNDGFSGLGAHYQMRYFLHGVVEYLWRGSLVFVAAEVADRLGWGREEAPPDEAHTPATPEI